MTLLGLGAERRAWGAHVESLLFPLLLQLLCCNLLVLVDAVDLVCFLLSAEEVFVELGLIKLACALLPNDACTMGKGGALSESSASARYPIRIHSRRLFLG